MIYRCGAKLAPRLFSLPGLVSPSCGRAVTFTKFPNIEQLLGEDGARSRAPERGRAVAGSRQPVFSERKIYNSLNLSLAVLRDLGTKYPFIRLSPPVVNINLHQVTAFILSVFIPGAVGSIVFRHGHQLICLMKVE